jgi:hypothetical protein
MHTGGAGGQRGGNAGGDTRPALKAPRGVIATGETGVDMGPKFYRKLGTLPGSAKYRAGFELANSMASSYSREVFRTLFQDPRVMKAYWSVYNWYDDGFNPRSKVWGKAFEVDRAYADQVEDWNKVYPPIRI